MEVKNDGAMGKVAGFAANTGLPAVIATGGAVVKGYKWLDAKIDKIAPFTPPPVTMENRHVHGAAACVYVAAGTVAALVSWIPYAPLGVDAAVGYLGHRLQKNATNESVRAHGSLAKQAAGTAAGVWYIPYVGGGASIAAYFRAAEKAFGAYRSAQ